MNRGGVRREEARQVRIKHRETKTWKQVRNDMLRKEAACPGQLMPETTGGTIGWSPPYRFVQNDSTRTRRPRRIDQKRVQLDADDGRTAASGSGQNHAVTATEVHEHIGRTDPKDVQNGIDHSRMQPTKRCEHIRRTTTDTGPRQRDMTSWGQHGFSRHDEGFARRLPRRIRQDRRRPDDPGNTDIHAER